jgi:hypothetical protein
MTPTSASLKPTEPEPFKLATEELASRRGPAHVLSTEEAEEKMIKEIKPFKARPVDPRVLRSAGDVGVAKVTRKPPTAPQPFALESDRLHRKAMEARAKAIAEEEEKMRRETEFKAAPVPGTVKVPEPCAKPAPKPPTQPAPVSLASSVRAHDREKFDVEKTARQLETERLSKENATLALVRPLKSIIA